MRHDQNDPVCQSQSPPLKRLWCIKMAIKQQFAIECGQTGNYMQSVCDITVINGDKSANIATAVLCPSAPLYEDIHNRQKFTLTSYIQSLVKTSKFWKIKSTILQQIVA